MHMKTHFSSISSYRDLSLSDFLKLASLIYIARVLRELCHPQRSRNIYKAHIYRITLSDTKVVKVQGRITTACVSRITLSDTKVLKIKDDLTQANKDSTVKIKVDLSLMIYRQTLKIVSWYGIWNSVDFSQRQSS